MAERRSSGRTVPGFILALFAADLAFAVAYLVDWKRELFWKLSALVDPYTQGSLPTWYASVKLFLVAFLFAAFARDRLDRRVKASWFLPILPLAFAVLSFDQIADLHTWLVYRRARMLPDGSLTRNLYYYRDVTVVATVVLTLLAIALTYSIRYYTNARPDIARKYLVGLLMFAASAAAIASLSVMGPSGVRARVLQLFCAELGKLLGLTVILWATYDLLVLHWAAHDNPARTVAPAPSTGPRPALP